MTFRYLTMGSLLTGLALWAFVGVPSAEAGIVRVRTFEFGYAATIKGLTPGREVRIWVPVPITTEDQDVTLLASEVRGAEPAKIRLNRESRYGNRMAYAVVRPGRDGLATLRFRYRVRRREVKGETGAKAGIAPAQLKRFLQADALVPITGKPLELVRGKKVPTESVAAARLFYDVVFDHMRYSKEGEGWGRGDSVWACDSKFGNCSDFHSLFISLARAQGIPARFEMGFPLPAKHGEGTIGGYHCWAFFHPPGKSWVPVDISEASKDPKLRAYYFGNLTPDRVAFSVGRDIDLEPRQADKPLNFFIYPHVEAEGKVVPQSRIDRTFTYRDIE